jgi:peptide/nickel transport system permease protein
VARFVLSRLLQTIPVLFGVTLGAFLVVHLVPGDPARIMLGSHASPEAVANLRHQLGLDRPLLVQYVDFVRQTLTFDFGNSITQRLPVATLLATRLIPSLLLIGLSLLFALVFAIPLGILSAIRRNRLTDHVIRLLTLVTFTMPPFWLGLILILVFAVQLGWVPTSGYGETTGEHLRALILPSVTLGMWVAPLFLRTLRSSIIENLGSEVTEAARARGYSDLRVMMRHVLPNSLIAMVTFVGISAGVLFSGTVIVESVFAIPGVGSLLVTAIIQRDFPVIQALTLVFGVAVVVVNFLTDVAYARLDPRVRL